MTTVLRRDEIEALLGGVDLTAAMEQAFVKYSQGLAVLPPVGELLFTDPPGDVHIKYGYISGDDCYVVKVASGFYRNPTLGLASSNGVMLLFRQQTGELLAVLLDEGHLTDIRTAAAGAVAARHLAPSSVECIGIVGCGNQGEQQLRCLAPVVRCRQVLVWGRDSKRLTDFQRRLADTDFRVVPAATIEALVERCRLIVTTTPSEQPLLHAVQAGTHVTAIGSDTPLKQELAPAVLAQADLVAVDSRDQSRSRGEVFRAVAAGAIDADRVVELGSVIAGSCRGRQTDRDITVADLTGIATQDIEIAKAIYQGALNAH